MSEHTTRSQHWQQGRAIHKRPICQSTSGPSANIPLLTQISLYVRRTVERGIGLCIILSAYCKA